MYWASWANLFCRLYLRLIYFIQIWYEVVVRFTEMELWKMRIMFSISFLLMGVLNAFWVKEAIERLIKYHKKYFAAKTDEKKD